VYVVFVPVGAAKFPPFVSLVPEHAGGLVYATLKVRVHVPVGGSSGSGVPIVTLPAESEPAIAAPTPQSVPSDGVPAFDTPDQKSKVARITAAA